MVSAIEGCDTAIVTATTIEKLHFYVALYNIMRFIFCTSAKFVCIMIWCQVEEFLKEYENVCSFRIQFPASSDLSNPNSFITMSTRSDKRVELLPISIEMYKRNAKGGT